MSIATFDPAAFKIRYPQFVSVADAALSACFNDAGFYLANTDNSIIQDVTRRTALLWMLTAHIAYLDGFTSLDGQPKPVGRISQAAEGSVNVSFEMLTPGSAAWFMQTQWGATFWQATANLRSMQYIPNPTRY